MLEQKCEFKRGAIFAMFAECYVSGPSLGILIYTYTKHTHIYVYIYVYMNIYLYICICIYTHAGLTQAHPLIIAGPTADMSL